MSVPRTKIQLQVGYDGKKEIHVGFTGSRKGACNREWKKILAHSLVEYTAGGRYRGVFHHGDCLGCDAEAHEVASECGYDIVIHPPTISFARAYCTGDGIKVLPTKSFLDRNRDIVDASGILIAVPEVAGKEVLRSGTWATIRYARAKGILVHML